MEKHTVQVFIRETTLCDGANNSCNAAKPCNVVESYHKIARHCVIFPYFCKWIEGGVKGGGGVVCYCKCEESSPNILYSLQTGSLQGHNKTKNPPELGSSACHSSTIKLNPLTPVPPVTARDEPWPFFLF